MHLLIVAGIAFVAAMCFGASNVVGERKASEVPQDSAMKLSMLLHLAKEPLWWLSIAVDLGGYGFQAWALALGQVAFVQPILVLSLPLSLMIGHWAGSHHLGRAELGWSVVFVSALAIFLVVGNPAEGVSGRHFRAWLLPLAAVFAGVTGCALYGMRGTTTRRAVALGMGAGAMFGLVSALTKTVTTQLGNSVFGTLSHWEVWMLIAAAIPAILLLNSAFQAGDLRSALPAISLSEPIVAVSLGVALFHERLQLAHAFSAALIVVSMIAMVVATVCLARSSAANAS